MPGPSSGLSRACVEATLQPSGQAKMTCSPPPPVIARQVFGNSPCACSSSRRLASPSWRGSMSSAINLSVTTPRFASSAWQPNQPLMMSVSVEAPSKPCGAQPAVRVLGRCRAFRLAARAGEPAVAGDRPVQRHHAVTAARQSQRMGRRPAHSCTGTLSRRHVSMICATDGGRQRCWVMAAATNRYTASTSSAPR